MKKAFIAAVCIAGIIAVRMILSISFSDQAAEIFYKISIRFLFYFSLCMLVKNRQKSNPHTISNNI